MMHQLRSFGKALAVMCWLGAMCGASPAQTRTPDPAATVSARSSITVTDLVREATIGDPFTTSWDDSARRRHVSTTSPDGRHVAVVLRWGDIERNANVGAILIYQTSELVRSPAPRRLVEFASTNNRQPISFVRWLPDNRSLLFAATEGDQPTQVYRADIRTAAVTRLTNEPNAVEWFDATPNARRLVTIRKAPPAPPSEDPACRRAGCLVTAHTLWAAQSGSKEGSGLLSVYDLEANTQTTLAGPETSDPDIASCADELTGGISPDGRFGLRACMLKPGRWPSWWRDYEVDPNLSSFLSRNNNSYALRLVITDLRSGENRTLTEAPFVWDQPAPVWLDRGRRLLLVGALEPLANAAAAETTRRRSTRSILVVDPATRSYERVGRLGQEIASITQTDWNEESQTMTLEMANAAGEPLTAVRYRRVGQRWTAAHSPRPRVEAERRTPRLLLHETLNTPATLMAIDPVNGVQKLVMDPNPWLAERRLGRVEEISWTPRNGRKWRGGLYYPPNYVAGMRYPLVILTHGFNDDRFSLYGYARNFAAQPLAARGMMVLQVEEKLRDVVGTPEEWPTVQAGYEAAIDHLHNLGLIDRTRVGIQGWSRTGMHAAYTLTHSSYPFAAGALTSTGGLGLWWYFAAGAEPSYEADYDAAPFGDGLDVWRRMAPSFNLDRVRTPMFMWEDANVAGLWDWYAGLRRLDVPVEYWHLPDGAHDVFKVGERLLTCQLLVDWFAFWLQGYEDPDPTKSQQYERWRRLRQIRNERTNG